jgi:hypothetical protein
MFCWRAIIATRPLSSPSVTSTRSSSARRCRMKNSFRRRWALSVVSARASASLSSTCSGAVPRESNS